MPANQHEGLPSDWRYCYHSYRECTGCGQSIFLGSQMVERKIKYWKDAEHWHMICALEKALWMIETYSQQPKRLLPKHKWKPKEPTR